MNEEHRRRDHPPKQHQKGDPWAGSDASQNDVARHLKQKISSEENTRAKTVDRVAEAQLVFHLKGGEANIDTVQIGDDVKKKKKRHKAPAEFGEQRLGEPLVIASRGR